jgi:hypothetical protein
MKLIWRHFGKLTDACGPSLDGRMTDMPLYHINVRTESHIASTVDVERESLTELRLEMARYVGELLKDHAELIWADEDWQIDVTDADGLILYVIHISATDTAATAGTITRIR